MAISSYNGLAPDAMERHVRIVGLLYVFCGALLVLLGLVMLLIFGGAGLTGATADSVEVSPFVFPLVGAVGGMLFIVLVALSIPAITAGAGLLKRRRWARILAIPLSGVFLLWVPVGTAVGIYSLWVLLSKRTEAMFVSEEAAAKEREQSSG